MSPLGHRRNHVKQPCFIYHLTEAEEEIFSGNPLWYPVWYLVSGFS